MSFFSGAGKSLKFKLLSLSLGIAMLLGMASLGVLKYIINTQKDASLHDFEAHAKTLGNAISAQFYERYGDVQTFSISPAILSSNKKSVSEMLNTFSAMYGIYDLIMLVDAKGNLVSVNDKDPSGKDINTQELYKKNYADAPWFKAVMSGQFTEDKDKGFSGTYVEEVQLDPYTTQVFGSNRLGSSFSAPVKAPNGTVVGVLTNRAGSRWFEVAFKELYTDLKYSGFPSTELTFLSKDGTVVYEYSSDPKSKTISDSKYDWDILLKYSLAKKASVVNALAGKTGFMVDKNVRKGIYQVTGYAPVTGPKFIDKLGWNVLVRDEEAEVNAALNFAQNIFYAIFAGVLVIAGLLAYFFSTNLSNQLSSLAAKLTTGSNEVLSASTSISQSSTELSEAAVEQASAIQETASSIDEVSSMVTKSSENATQSQKVSQSSRSNAKQGQKAVEDMIQSINEISQSNAVIMNQVEEGNKQISEIVKVIAEIGNKTKVINDIVFQTKLLSFNASVEAARAGEHGKGFAVVAEEVGNLAQMSGNAAKEISAMLDSSIQKVEGIVSDTKSKVEHLIVDNKSKVETGTQVANRCGEALTSILATVEEVDSMVGQISSASSEQSQGISEINKAMNQLDQVTQQNTAVAQNAASSAEQLNAQATELRYIVRDLFVMINGSENQDAPPASNSAGQHSHQTKTPKANKHDNVHDLSQARKKQKTSFSASSKNIKMAVGAESMPANALPSKNDPRFEDV